jgi:hypothetical protein
MPGAKSDWFWRLETFSGVSELHNEGDEAVPRRKQSMGAASRRGPPNVHKSSREKR